MNKFVAQPLLEKLNRENILTRLRKVEERSGVRPSASVGSLAEFTQGTGDLIVQGSIKVINQTDGGADVIIDEFGVFFRNQEGSLNFEDTNGSRDTLVVYASGGNWLVLENSFGGKGISMLLDDSTGGTHQIDFGWDGTFSGIDVHGGSYHIDQIEYSPKSAFHFHDDFICSTPETKAANASQRYQTWAFQTAPADGQFWDMGIFIAAGTYTCTVLGETDNVSAKLDWTLDGVSQTTGQDWYSVGATGNVEKSFTLTATKSGYQKLTATVNGKNGSSGNYYWTHTALYITPAAY